MHLNMQCLAYDPEDFVIEYESTLCSHSILLCVLLCLLPIQKKLLCENVGSGPVNTQALKQSNSPIAFWGITHVFEVKYSHLHLQERSLMKVLWSMWINIINEFLLQHKWLNPTPPIAVV